MKKTNTTISRHLAVNITLTIFSVIAVMAGVAAWRDVSHFRDYKTTHFQALAYAYGSIATDSLERQDVAQAYDILSQMGLPPLAAQISINTPTGELLASLGAPSLPPPTGANAFAILDTAIYSVMQKAALTSPVEINVVREGRIIGSVHIEPEVSTLHNNLQNLIKTWLITSAITAIISLLTVMRMVNRIAYPIQSLNKAMQTVRKTGDFRRRVKRISSDETGELAESFNAMLNYIQERDQQLRTNRQNLREMVRKRTEQLNNAKEAAEAASRTKSEFLATMSHEIRTPMNGMMVLAQLLSNSSLGKRQQRYADLIVKSGDSLLAIINDILDLSKIEAGQLALEAIPVRPSDIIDDVVSLFYERARSEGLDLAAHISTDTPEEIEGDPTRLNQLLSNLVNNAIKFTEKGSILVAVQMLKRPDGPDAIEFSVTDTGIGIAPEKQRQIFEAFTQEDQSTTRKFGGSGLGLAICSKIVRDMNGEISVKSALDEGSRFSFNLPAKILKPASPAIRPKRPLHAMIALDGSATQNSLTRYLHESNITTRKEDSSNLTATHMNYADVIFGSPEILKLYAKALAGSPTHALPARICITSLDDQEGDPLLESGEADDLLTTPFSRAEVLAQLDRFLTDNLRGPSALTAQDPAILKLPSFEGSKILAADDSAVNRAVVRAALARFDVNPDIVADGRAALKAAKTISYDLILMDCSMPHMDGFEATRAIRAYEKEKGLTRTPIAALTAQVANAKQEWRKAGMDAFILKPFTISSLGQEIARHITPAGYKTIADEDKDTSPKLDHPPSKSAKPETNAAAFDEKILQDLATIQEEGGDALVLRALSLFEEHSKEAYAALDNTLAKGDNVAIARAAHALKSMSVNVGANILAQICSDLEQLASDGQDTAPLGEKIKDVFQHTHDNLPSIKAQFANKAA